MKKIMLILCILLFTGCYKGVTPQMYIEAETVCEFYGGVKSVESYYGTFNSPAFIAICNSGAEITVKRNSLELNVIKEK